jgi:inward rectifier potassium channel
VGKILFSEQAIIAPYHGGRALMFRIANAQNNQLVEVEIQLMLSWIEDQSGARVRKFYQLPLERNKVNFLATSWTIVHPIDERSPLYGLTEAGLRAADTECMVMVKGFDDTYFQTIYVRSSYKYHEITWGARFVSTYERSKNGSTVVDLSTLGVFEPAALPPLPSASSLLEGSESAPETELYPEKPANRTMEK